MKKNLVVFLVVALVFALSASVFAAFRDVPSNHWANKSISRLSTEKIINGDGDGNYRPDDFVSRAEFITMLMRIFEPEAKANMSSYKDVDKNAWYYDELAKAVAMPAIQGDSTSKMRPDDFISRQEAILIINRIIELKAKNEAALKGFDDYKDVASWAEDAVAALIENEYVNGYPDNTIRPKQYITRAEVAKLIDEMIGMIITDAGEYDLANVHGIVVVKAKNVSLKNTSNVDRIFVLNDDVKDTLKIDGKKATDKDVSVINPKEKTKETTSGGSGGGSTTPTISITGDNDELYTFKKSGSPADGKKLVIKYEGDEIYNGTLNSDNFETIIDTVLDQLNKDKLAKTLATNYKNEEIVKKVVDKMWASLKLDAPDKAAAGKAGDGVSSDIVGRYDTMYELYTALTAAGVDMVELAKDSIDYANDIKPALSAI